MISEASGIEPRHVMPDDPEYERLARLEAEFWRSAHAEFGVEALETAGADTAIDRYTNRRFTGDERTPWYATIAKYGPFRRGLMLGTSGMGQDGYILRANPGLHLTFCDISAASLERWQRELERRFPGRVSTMEADLNFVDLPEASYDVIISSSTLHHVINLEHVAAEISRALTDAGLFFLHDFTGESMFRFAPEKRRLFGQLYHRDRVRRGQADPGLIWSSQDRSEVSPFCGIRSGDILGALAQELDPVEVRTCGALVNLVLHTRPADWDGKPPAQPLIQRVERRVRKHVPLLRARPAPLPIDGSFLRELLLMDELVCDAGLCVPNSAFAIYRRRVAAGGGALASGPTRWPTRTCACRPLTASVASPSSWC